LDEDWLYQDRHWMDEAPCQGAADSVGRDPRILVYWWLATV